MLIRDGGVITDGYNDELDELPTWNVGDEFEAVRLEALAAQHE
jgi:hypothetical protein